MKSASVCLPVCIVAGLMLGLTASQLRANPRYGAECQFCHASSSPGPLAALEVTGADQVLDGHKVFLAVPGQSIDLGFHVTPGDPPVYYLALRALDRLDGEPAPGEPHPAYYKPRLYTPDSSWSTTDAMTGEQYLYWNGQFYVTPKVQVAEGDFAFNLTLGEQVALGDYELIATAGGGFPFKRPGGHPEGGWTAQQEFTLRVVPEPASLLLIALSLPAVFIFAARRRNARGGSILTAIIALLLVFAVRNNAQAWPSRSGDCYVCHGRTSPPKGTADFDVQNSAGGSSSLFEVAPGGSTELVFQVTDLPLVDPPPTDPAAPVHRRFYLVLDGLDLVNVNAPEDIPYTSPKYTAPDVSWIENDGGIWHWSRTDERYVGSSGQYYTISDTELRSIPFRLTLGPDVLPGDYDLTAQLVGGRPHDEEGWYVMKDFTLRVLPGAQLANVPEPAAITLIGAGLIAGLAVWRRR